MAIHLWTENGKEIIARPIAKPRSLDENAEKQVHKIATWENFGTWMDSWRDPDTKKWNYVVHLIDDDRIFFWTNVRYCARTYFKLKPGEWHYLEFDPDLRLDEWQTHHAFHTQPQGAYSEELILHSDGSIGKDIISIMETIERNVDIPTKWQKYIGRGFIVEGTVGKYMVTSIDPFRTGTTGYFPCVLEELAIKQGGVPLPDTDTRTVKLDDAKEDVTFRTNLDFRNDNSIVDWSSAGATPNAESLDDLKQYWSKLASFVDQGEYSEELILHSKRSRNFAIAGSVVIGAFLLWAFTRQR